MMKVHPVLAVVACTVLLAACGRSDVAESNGDAKTFVDVIDTAISKAHEDPLTDEIQYQALLDAQSAGELPFDTLADAMQRTMTCLELAGFTGGRIRIDDDLGFPLPAIVDLAAPASMADSQANTLIDNCQRTSSTYISYAYAQQPASQDAYWALADAAVPTIRTCLEAAGIPGSAIGPTTAEVVDTAVAFLMELDSELTQYGSEDCLGDLPVPKSNR